MSLFLDQAEEGEMETISLINQEPWYPDMSSYEEEYESSLEYPYDVDSTYYARKAEWDQKQQQREQEEDAIAEFMKSLPLDFDNPEYSSFSTIEDFKNGLDLSDEQVHSLFKHNAEMSQEDIDAFWRDNDILNDLKKKEDDAFEEFIQAEFNKKND